MYCKTKALDGYDLCDVHLEIEEEGGEIRRRQRTCGITPTRTRHSEIKARAKLAVHAMFLDREARRNGVAKMMEARRERA